MTKQERIEEMANYIAKCCPDKVDDGCFDKNMNCVSCIAMELYNAGYRKEDEVRKETAEKFAERLKQLICDNTYPYFDKDGKPVIIWNTDGFGKIDELLEQYGVDLVE